MAVQGQKIFLESSVFISFIDRADPNHQKTVALMNFLGRSNFQLFTSAQNINEVYSVLSREIGTSIALEFLDSVLQSELEILFPQKADLITTERILKTNHDRQIGIKEALNATLMQKRGIVQILTFTYWHNLFGTHVSNLIV